MNAIEALQILITADASGIEGVLKSAGSDITQFIQKASKKGIDWQKVFSASAMTFAATSAGALFATMIARTMQFQAALIGSSTDASSTFGNYSSAMGDSAVKIANTTGQSTDALIGSLAQTVTHFGDVATGIMVAQKAAELAGLGFGNLDKNTQQISDIMKNDMVTSADQVSTKMDQIFVASKNSNLGLDEFLSILSNLGPSIASVPFNTLVSSLAAFSKRVGVTGPIAQDVFTHIANWIALPNSVATIMATSTVPNLYKAIQNKDPIAALQAIEKEMSKGSVSATALAQQTNLSNDSLIIMGKQGSKSVQSLKTSFYDLKKGVDSSNGSLDVFAENNISSTQELQKAWQSIQNLLISIATSPLIMDITKHISEMADAATMLVKDLSGANGIVTASTDVIAGLSGISYYANRYATKNEAAQALQNQLNTSGMSSVESAKIMSKAEQAPDNVNLMNELVQALKMGTMGMSSSQTATLYSTFNITAPQGGESMTAEQITKQLYKQFQGIK